MKKIFFAIVSIFALSACIKEELPIVQQQNGEGDMVTLTFDVKVPEAGSAITRSMSEPKIARLDVLVFDHEGYFVGKAVATPNENVTPENPEEQQAFSVSLTSTSNPRSIHFIANCPEAGNINFGHEDAFISNLMVDGDVDAYWQCMKFTNGIAEQANAATTVDATIFSNNTVVPLVRNFARVSVTSTAANFELTGFAVMNTRTGGTVAAYAQNKGEFVEYTKPSTTDNTSFVAKTYQELVSEVGYTGFEAGDLNDDVNNTTWGSPSYTEENGDKVNNYLYVRETAAASSPCIIVKGKYNGGAETYYKLDFMLSKAADGTPMEAPVLRNFSYEFKITLVTKSGYTSAQAAYEGHSDNNLSADSATESLLNISDGASQLFVNATSVTLVSGDQYYLMYKYLPTIGGGADNSLVNIEVDNTDVTDPIFPEGALTKPNNNIVQSLYDAAVADGNTDLAAYYKEYLDYNYVILDPVDPKDVPLSQTVNVTAGNLYRKVNFDLRKKIDMTVAAYGVEEDGLVSAALNQEVNVDITIPKGLPHSIFPLEFVIEADALSIYPDAAKNNLPVRSGKSIIPGKNETTFGFVKTYTLAEYIAAGGENNPVTINTYFLTNKAASASQVYVYNEYFATGNDDFKNSKPKRTNNITVTLGEGDDYYGAGRAVTLDITLPEAPAGTEVSVDVTGFNITGTRATTYTTDSNGQVKLSLSTTEWAGTRSVTVSSSAEVETDDAIVVYASKEQSVTVNKLYIPADSFDSNINSNYTSVSVKSGNTSATGNITFNSDGTNDAETITLPGLASDATLTLTYSTGSYQNRTTYTADTTVEAAMSENIDYITFAAPPVQELNVYSRTNNLSNTTYTVDILIDSYSGTEIESVSYTRNNNNSRLSAQIDISQYNLNNDSYIYFVAKRNNNTYYAKATVQSINNSEALNFSTSQN